VGCCSWVFAVWFSAAGVVFWLLVRVLLLVFAA
jgi:hypothetical protein